MPGLTARDLLAVASGEGHTQGLPNKSNTRVLLVEGDPRPLGMRDEGRSLINNEGALSPRPFASTRAPLLLTRSPLFLSVPLIYPISSLSSHHSLITRVRNCIILLPESGPPAIVTILSHPHKARRCLVRVESTPVTTRL